MEHIKSFSQAFLLAGTLAVGATTVVADDQTLDLEPCINGGVSATGRFETQALEDAALGSDEQVAVSDESLGSGADDVISAFGGNRDDFPR